MSRVTKGWLRQRQPSCGPRGAEATPAAYAAALQETQVIAAAADIGDTQIPIEVESDSRILLQAVVGGVVAGASNDVKPLVEIRVEEFDADGVSLGLVEIPNARQQSPSITDGESAVVTAMGIYTPSDPATASIVAVARGSAPGTDGTWTLNPDVAVDGGAVLSAHIL